MRSPGRENRFGSGWPGRRAAKGVIVAALGAKERVQRAKTQHPRKVFDPGRSVAEVAIDVGRDGGYALIFQEKVSGVRKAVAECKEARESGRGRPRARQRGDKSREPHLLSHSSSSR